MKFTNRLLIYSGGGYSGNIFELNSCVWDSTGKWHNIFSSGFSGFKSEECADQFFEYNSNIPIENNVRINRGDGFHMFELFDITDKEHMDYFRENYNPFLVFGFIEYAVEHDIETVCMFKCYMCDKEGTFIDEFTKCNTSCDGGIHISYKDIICVDCKESHTCTDCYEWEDDESNFINHRCKSCHEKEIENSSWHLDIALKQNDVSGISVWNTVTRKLIDAYTFKKPAPECQGQLVLNLG